MRSAFGLKDTQPLTGLAGNAGEAADDREVAGVEPGRRTAAQGQRPAVERYVHHGIHFGR